MRAEALASAHLSFFMFQNHLEQIQPLLFEYIEEKLYFTHHRLDLAWKVAFPHNSEVKISS